MWCKLPSLVLGLTLLVHAHAQQQPPPTVPAPPPATKREFQPPPERPDAEARPSSSSGEPIYDWKKYNGEREIHHPFAEKGLIRISKDREYFYKVGEGEHHHAYSLQAGPMNPTFLKNPTSNQNATFADNYGTALDPLIIFSKEWQLWTTAVGKFGIRAGTGAFVAQGHGHFVAGVDQFLVPEENLTFIALPNYIGGVYRAQFTHRPLFVPYGEGGAIAFTFTEVRDDSKGPKYGGALAAYLAGGVGINMTYWDYMTRIELNREYGVGAIYFTVEFRQILGLSAHYDFTSSVFNGGLLVEY